MLQISLVLYTVLTKTMILEVASVQLLVDSDLTSLILCKLVFSFNLGGA